MIFSGGQIDFVTHQTTNGGRGVPLYLLGRDDSPTGAGSESMSVTCRDFDVTNFRGVAVLRVNNCLFKNATFRADDQDAVATQWRARALNTLAGGAVVPQLRVKGDPVIRYAAQNETSLGNNLAVVARRGSRASSRDTPASLFTSSLSPTNGAGGEEIVNPRPVVVLNKGSFTGVALSGRTLTFSYGTGAEGNLNILELKVGSVVWDDNQGFVFIITARTIGSGTTSFAAELQNGYWVNNSGVIQYEQPFSASSGNFYFSGGGFFTPASPLHGDVSTTSVVIANCQRGDGYGGFINNTAASPVQTGDLLWVNAQTDEGFALYAGQKIVSVGAASITMQNNAITAQAKRRLPLWMRGS